MKYKIDFTIPQGPTGPIGPTGQTGPTGNMSLAFGELISTSKYTYDLTTSRQPINLKAVLSSYNVTLDTTDSSITIQEPGYYEVSYYVSITTVDEPTYVTASLSNFLYLKQEKYVNKSTTSEKYITDFFVKAFVLLQANTKLYLNLAASSPIKVTTGELAQLTVMKLKDN